MLGKDGGLRALPGFLTGKVSDAKFEEAMIVADAVVPADLSQESKFAVNTSGSSKANPARDALRKKLLANEKPAREIASYSAPAKKMPKASAEPMQIESLPGENLLGLSEPEELTLFDVVHQKYRQLSDRLKR